MLMATGIKLDCKEGNTAAVFQSTKNLKSKFSCEAKWNVSKPGPFTLVARLPDWPGPQTAYEPPALPLNKPEPTPHVSPPKSLQNHVGVSKASANVSARAD